MTAVPAPPTAPPIFVVQEHWSKQRHFDFRLEISGRLVSWALPKGPSLDPSVRRLAVRTMDHPLGYAIFEGVIPAPQYGAGLVVVWDTGTFRPLLPKGLDEEAWLTRGRLKFLLRGQKLHGLWEMVRYREEGTSEDEDWLLVKHRDRFARRRFRLESLPTSALTGRTPDEIERSSGKWVMPDHAHPLETWVAPSARPVAEG